MTKPQLTREDWKQLLAPIEEHLRLCVGAVAVDKENGGRLLIIDRVDESADERVIEPLGWTVAEENPEYPDDDTVFIGVYLDTLPDFVKTKEPLLVALDTRRRDLAKYEFPESRLKAIAPDRVTLGDFDSRRRGGE